LSAQKKTPIIILQQEINDLEKRYDEEDDDDLEKEIETEIDVKKKTLRKLVKLQKAASLTPDTHRAIRILKVVE